MFIVNLTYTTDLEIVDQFLNDHIEFLDQQYELGYFLASGRKIPRTGGVILANAASRSELEGILEQDPFQKNELATYEITEFIPNKTVDQLNFLIE